MSWINVYGLIFMIVIMLPNIIFSVKDKDGFKNLWRNRGVEILEQIGRYACLGFMILIIPGAGFGFPSDRAFALYLIIDGALTAVYCLIWIICFRQNSIFRALALSIIPPLVFLVSGILSHYIPLVIGAVIFAPCHITISYKNAALSLGKTPKERTLKK